MPRPATLDSPVDSLLGEDLARYVAVVQSGGYDLTALVREAGLICGRCRDGRCARRHAIRRRRRIQDLESGRTYERVPIVRVLFCDGRTASLAPAAIWRGRATIRSVLVAVHRAARDGVRATLGWATHHDAAGEEPLTERTLRRWQRIVPTRLIGEPSRWLAAHGVAVPVSKLAGIEPLIDLPASTHLAFRARFGRTLLDTVTRPGATSRTSARRVPGRLVPAAPPDPPPDWLPRGTRLPRRRRGPPARGDPHGGDR